MKLVMRESEDLLECAPLTVHKIMGPAVHRKTAVVTMCCHHSFLFADFGAQALRYFFEKTNWRNSNEKTDHFT